MTAAATHPFPPGFLWGCASAAHQVEGGTENDWTVFERLPGRIRDGSVSGIACDHWNRYPEDLRDYAAFGHNAHRFSVEWSRVEPQPGRYDEAALLHYRDVVAHCRQLGLEPVVTLHHFTLPLWLADRGGVCAEEAPPRFAAYAARVVEALGGQVSWWITVNEPVVLATLGYLYGEWPPQACSVGRAFAALRGLLRMHAAATLAIRDVAAGHGWPARVSVAHHVRGLRPARPASPLDHLAAALPDFLLNRWWLLACRDGIMRPPVAPWTRVPGAAGSLDWIGLNYYCDDLVAFDPRHPKKLFVRQFADPTKPTSSFGWAIDAGGLERALLWVWRTMRLPIVVTENGVADEADELRPRFLCDHVAAVGRALAAGAEVRGYLHWTAMDNFEWAEGYSKRFGLWSVDRVTLERRPKPSAYLFARICRANGLPADLGEGTGATPAAAAG